MASTNANNDEAALAAAMSMMALKSENAGNGKENDSAAATNADSMIDDSAKQRSNLNLDGAARAGPSAAAGLQQQPLSDASSKAQQQHKELAKRDAAQKELDKMFEENSSSKLHGIPEFVHPAGLKDSVQLYDYQKDGVRWLLHQEMARDRMAPFVKKVQGRNGEDVYKCTLTQRVQSQMPVSPASSILADDMGLGKTISSIVLVLSNKPKPNAPARCTLIVAPVSVIAGWRMQFEQFTKPGHLKVVEYKGDKRAALLPKVKTGKIDVLLVSYETLVSDYKAHQKHLTEKDEARAKAAKKAEKRREAEAAWKSSHGGSDSEDSFEPDDDSSDDDDHYLPSSALSRKKQPSTWIFNIPLFRVILDEAHSSRNANTGKFKAVMALQAENKLALTGTPFVNKPMDLYSLFAFLGAAPLDDQKLFKAMVADPIANRREIGLARVRMMMSHLALRRTKAVLTDTIQLPAKDVVIRACEWSEEAGSFHGATHEHIYQMARATYSALLSLKAQKRLDKGSFMLFISLVQKVRQACCHGGLVAVEARQLAEEIFVLKSNEDGADGGDLQFALDSDKDMALLRKILNPTMYSPPSETYETYDSKCSVCNAELESEAAAIMRFCEHALCPGCVDEGTTNIEGDQCILCVHPNAATKTAGQVKDPPETQKKEEAKPKEKKLMDGLDEMHPKEVAVLDEISKMKPDEKCVIFSEWTSVLDLMQNMLVRKGYACTRIVGSKNTDQRVQAMTEFSSDDADSPRIILCSLMACGTGITLTRGSLAIIVEPWFNSAVEEQAMDRIYRIGQTRPVRVVRLIMKDSLEERMLTKVQEAKAALGKGSMQKLSAKERNKAKVTAMKDLFELSDAATKWEGQFDDDDDFDDFIED